MFAYISMKILNFIAIVSIVVSTAMLDGIISPSVELEKPELMIK